MRAVKIDPVSRTVTEINLKKNPNNTLEELYKIIGCDLVELVQIDRDMVLICDEEGKLKEIKSGFTFLGWASEEYKEKTSSSFSKTGPGKLRSFGYKKR